MTKSDAAKQKIDFLHQDINVEQIHQNHCKGCTQNFEKGLLSHLRYHKTCSMAYTPEEIESIRLDNRKKQYKQYKQKNKDRLSEKNKEHWQKNKTALSEKNKEYWEKNKADLSEKNKEYWDKNKPDLSAKNKEYKQKN